LPTNRHVDPLLTGSGSTRRYDLLNSEKEPTQMTRIVTILTEGFADWETGLLNGVARCFYGAETQFATPGGKPVTSTGGMQVTPQMALEDIDVDGLDALVVCGGEAWQKPSAPDLTTLLNAALAKGKVIGAICDGTVAAARTGLLDTLAHTSNGAGYLDATGYKGKRHYRDVPHAVVDRRVVTAAATAPASFMAAIMREVGLGDEQLDFYLGLLAAEHGPRAEAA
jgi:putative intracellular protease/amidase